MSKGAQRPASPTKNHGNDKRRRKPKIIPDSYDGPFDFEDKDEKNIKIVKASKDDLFEPLQPGQKRRRRKKTVDIADTSTSSAPLRRASDTSNSINEMEELDIDKLEIPAKVRSASEESEDKKPALSKSIADINETVDWTYPEKGDEYSFELGRHHVVSQNGKKVYKCDICLGFYKHMFSLKRHYLRNHINYKYLSKADMTNCLINLAQAKLNMSDKSKSESTSSLESVKEESAIKTGDNATENNGNGDNTTENNGTGDNTTENNGNGDNTTENNGNGDNTTENNGNGDNTMENNGTGDSTSENNGTGDSTTENNGTGDNTMENNGTGYSTTENNGTGVNASEDSGKTHADDSDRVQAKDSVNENSDKVVEKHVVNGESATETAQTESKVKSEPKEHDPSETKDQICSSKEPNQNLSAMDQNGEESLNSNGLNSSTNSSCVFSLNGDQDINSVDAFKSNENQNNCRVKSEFPGLFKCYTCYELFDAIPNIRDHLQEHTGQKPGENFTCERCNMHFTFKQNLVRHQKTHEEEGKYNYGVLLNLHSHRYSNEVCD